MCSQLMTTIQTCVIAGDKRLTELAGIQKAVFTGDIIKFVNAGSNETDKYG